MRQYLFVKVCYDDGKHELEVVKTSSSPEDKKGRELLDLGYMYGGSFSGFNVGGLCKDYDIDGTKIE